MVGAHAANHDSVPRHARPGQVDVIGQLQGRPDIRRSHALKIVPGPDFDGLGHGLHFFFSLGRRDDDVF